MTTTFDTNHLNFFSPNVIDLFGGEENFKKIPFSNNSETVDGESPVVIESHMDGSYSISFLYKKVANQRPLIGFIYAKWDLKQNKTNWWVNFGSFKSRIKLKDSKEKNISLKNFFEHKCFLNLENRFTKEDYQICKYPVKGISFNQMAKKGLMETQAEFMTKRLIHFYDRNVNSNAILKSSVDIFGVSIGYFF